MKSLTTETFAAPEDDHLDAGGMSTPIADEHRSRPAIGSGYLLRSPRHGHRSTSPRHPAAGEPEIPEKSISATTVTHGEPTADVADYGHGQPH